MIKFTVAHRKDPNNVGDIASNPLQYFLNSSEYEVIDVVNISRQSYDSTIPMIIGGGGLIGNDFMGDFFVDVLDSPDRLQLVRMWSDAWVLRNPEHQEIFDEFHEKFRTLVNDAIEKIPKLIGPRIVWGAGHNGNIDIEFEDIKWPKSLVRFAEVGIRDYHTSSRFDWTPCASCMHPGLRKKYEIKNEVIWFEHKKQLQKEFGEDPIPRFINSGSNVEQTIELLGSANVIITNSYHGAYWGTLLNKKVIVSNPWSSKFKFLKHKPYFIGKKENWKDIIDQVDNHPYALDECIEATEKYWNKIKGFAC